MVGVPHKLGRRSLLTAPALLLSRPAATASLFPEDFRMLVAGRPGGIITAWADRLSSAMLGDPPGDPKIVQEVTGGDDGVTAANQFATRVTPDGTTALLAPGSTFLARLVGDPRAQFDPGNWLAVLAGVSPSICFAKRALAELPPGTIVRVAAAGPTGPELGLMLGLSLLGFRLEPIFGLSLPEEAERAIASGAVDAIMLQGPAAVARGDIPNLTAQFTFGLPNEAGWERDYSRPELPTLADLIGRRQVSDDLVGAWRAVAVSAQIQFALMLPTLSPAPLVAQWRRAGDAAIETLQHAVTGVRPLSAHDAIWTTKMIAPDAQSLMALHKWLFDYLKWQPT